jgi:uncharacterized protein (TIGR02996 family)
MGLSQRPPRKQARLDHRFTRRFDIVPSAEAFFHSVCPSTEERSLVTALRASPDDWTVRSAYADWLEERGDLRGDFLRLQQGLATSMRKKALNTQLDDLRSRIAPEWLAVVGDCAARFVDLQKRIPLATAEYGWNDSLHVDDDQGLLDVHFRGNPCADELDELLRLLVSREVAPVLRSYRLEIDGERGYANGTCHVSLDWISDAGLAFPRLIHFELPLLERVVIGMYEDNGELARLLQKCPALERLFIPSAPKPSFFERDEHPLIHLHVHAGYAHEDFLFNLGRSRCFPHLRSLEYLDFRETYVDGWEANCTSFEHLESFFRSPVMKQLETFVLRHVNLSPAQVPRLLTIRRQGVTIERCGDEQSTGA